MHQRTMHEYLTFLLHQAEWQWYQLQLFSPKMSLQIPFFLTSGTNQMSILDFYFLKIRHTLVPTIYMVCLEMINCIFTQNVRSPTIAMQSEFTTLRIVV